MSADKVDDSCERPIVHRVSEYGVNRPPHNGSLEQVSANHLDCELYFLIRCSSLAFSDYAGKRIFDGLKGRSELDIAWHPAPPSNSPLGLRGPSACSRSVGSSLRASHLNVERCLPSWTCVSFPHNARTLTLRHGLPNRGDRYNFKNSPSIVEYSAD